MIFLKKIELYLPFLIPSLLVFSRTIADLTIIFISILFIYRSLILKEFIWLKHPIIKFYLFLIFYLLFINSIFSINFIESFIYSLAFIRWPLFSLAIALWIFKDEISFNRLLFGILITFIFFLMDVWYQYLFDAGGIFGLSNNTIADRLSIPLSNNVFPGRFILFFFFIYLSVYFFIKRRNIEKINLNYIFFILIIGSLSTFISGERVSFLIFTTSSLFFLLLIFSLRSINFTHFLSFLSVFLLLPFIFYYYDVNQFNRIIYSTIDKLSNFSSSDYGIIFDISIEKWKNNFFFGGGLHQFKNIYPVFGIDDKYLISHAHNLPLNLLAETGIFGLIFFYAIIFRILIWNIVSIKWKNHTLLIALNSILLYITFFPFHTHFKLDHNWINAISWLIIGLILGMLKVYEENYSNKKSKHLF